MATEYKVPTLVEPAPPKPNEVVLVTSGDLRHTANVVGWAEQQVLEQQIADVLAEAQALAELGPRGFAFAQNFDELLGSFELVARKALKDRIECEVVRGGPVRTRQGVSVPAERMSPNALDAADAVDERFYDFFAVSHVLYQNTSDSVAFA